MRGHIVQRYPGSGSYSIKVSIGKDATTGKYKYQWFTVKGDRKNAEKRLTEILHQIDTGSFMQPGKTTVAEYLNRWIGDYAKSNLSPRTVEGYEHIIKRYIIPRIGDTLLAHVRPEHLQRFYADELTIGLSAQTVRHHHMVLHKALQNAVEWGLAIRNVADAVKAPRAQRVEMQTWNESEITQFLEVAKTTPYYEVFFLALFTGMRRSELLALRWCDVDLIYGQIHVSRSLHVLKSGQPVFRSPKTAAGRRTIALTPSTSLMLTEYREKREAESILLGKPIADMDLVFNALGKHLLPNTVTHAWSKLVKHSGLRSIRLHDARHSHASLMLKQGVHPKIVQERLGHSSIQITLDTYSHVAPGLQEAAAKRFDDAFKLKHNENVAEKISS